MVLAATAVNDLAAGASFPVAFRTLGCKVNRVESEDMASDLLGRGCELVPEGDAAVIIINTCTVTGDADRKARKAVRHALGQPSAPVVVVTGCLAAVDPKAIREISERVVVEPDKERVADVVASVLKVSGAPHEHAIRQGRGFRTRAMLKIEDGCDNFCTYCIVPYARGVPKSVALEDVVSEAERLVSAGTAEIVLTGINIGRYRDGDARLSALIREVAATGIARLRLSSVEPPHVDDDLLDVMARTPSVVAHLHVPLQSGSDRILRAMGRHYSGREFEFLIAHARGTVPGLVITTDVMAGFPGETSNDARDSLALCERVGFSKMHVFRYSERPGTSAAKMAGAVPPAERAARAEALRILGHTMRENYIDSIHGQERIVLIERGSGASVTGTTEDYLRVQVHGADSGQEGRLLTVRIDGNDGEVARGVCVAPA